MTDRVPELALALAAECGALQEFLLWYELDAFVGERAFVGVEVCAHAALSENWRLRAAILAVCLEVSGRKLGKVLEKWAAKDIGLLWAEKVGHDPLGNIWRLCPVHFHTREQEGAECPHHVGILTT